jgi:hypothetical protein
MLENLIGQHGQSNVQSAMNNNMLGSLVSQLSQAIQCAPGIPQFAKDELCQALQDVQQGCPAEPTPPGCQQDADNSMSGLIDKIVDKVFDKIMQKLQGGGCENGGSIQGMVRQAIEDVVREMIGGGAEDGGSCPANDGAGSGTAASSSEADSSSQASDTSDVRSSITTACGEDEKKAKNGSGSWLVALAKAMGAMTGDHLQKMMQAQDRMEDSKVYDADLKGKSEKEQAQIKQEKGK